MLRSQYYRLWIAGALCALAFSVLSFTNIEKTGQTDLQKDNLRGKVKSIEKITYTAELKATDAKDLLTEKYRGYKYYNPAGNITKEQYDDYELRPGEFYLDSDTYIYNAQGQKVHGLHIRVGHVDWTDSFYYDKRGNNITEIRYNPDGTLQCTINRKYDDSGRLTERAFRYTKPVRPEFDIKYIDAYNDETKTMISKYSSRNGGLFIGATAKYDTLGNFIEYSALDTLGNINYKETTTYDKYGNELTLISTNRKGKVRNNERYEYEYDSLGNWTKQTCYFFGKQRTIHVRHITYY